MKTCKCCLYCMQLLEILAVILCISQSVAGNNCIVYAEGSVSFNDKLLVSLMYLSMKKVLQCKLISLCRCLDIYIQACTNYKDQFVKSQALLSGKKLSVGLYNGIQNGCMYKLLQGGAIQPIAMMTRNNVCFGSPSGSPVSFPVSKSAKGAHTE